MGSVRLRVHVDQQHALTRLGEARGQVDGGRRLADAALLVCDCVDQRIRPLLPVIPQAAGGLREPRPARIRGGGGACTFLAM